MKFKSGSRSVTVSRRLVCFRTCLVLPLQLVEVWFSVEQEVKPTCMHNRTLTSASSVFATNMTLVWRLAWNFGCCRNFAHLDLTSTDCILPKSIVYCQWKALIILENNVLELSHLNSPPRNKTRYMYTLFVWSYILHRKPNGHWCPILWEMRK